MGVRSVILVLICASLLLACCMTGRADDDQAEDETGQSRDREIPSSILGPLPDIALLAKPLPDDGRKKRIKQAIDALVELDAPDYGFSATLSGSNFAPLPDQGEFHAGILTNHNLKTSETLKTLVEFGPDALPQLVDALGDARPTKIEVRGFSMWHGGELGGNRVNPLEKDVYQQRDSKEFRDRQEKMEGEHVDSHTVTVGDVCFVIIGQITGRSYSAVRYQPTACVILNSPSHDAVLREQVKSIWKGPDGRKTLFESLRADYATQGSFNGKSLDEWDVGNHFQCSAALRLLYYFPTESAALLARRIDSLDLKADGDVDDFMKRAVANGVRADEFIKAVAWSKEPSIRDAVTRCFKRAGEIEEFMACIPAVDDIELVRTCCEERLANLPAESRPYGDGYSLLNILIQRSPTTAQQAVLNFLKSREASRCNTVCGLLARVKVPWDADVLGPFLDDKRETTDRYDVDEAEDSADLPLRICDKAAFVLAKHHAELTFELKGEHLALDRQIASMKKELGLKE